MRIRGVSMLLDAMYICSSPFQVLTAMILAAEHGEEADIYVNGFFSRFDRYVEILKSSGLFKTVRTVPYEIYAKYFNQSGRLTSRLQAVGNYLSPGRVSASFIPLDCSYRKIYTPNRDILGRYVQFAHFRRGIKTELILFEEGNSAYMDAAVLRENSVEKALRRLLYGKKAEGVPLLLYSPELFFGMKNQYPNQVLSITVSEKTVERLRQIFGGAVGLPDNSAVIIDTHKSAIFDSDNKKKLEDYYLTIAETLRGGVFLKKHPREYEDAFEIGKTIDNDNPLEVLYLGESAGTLILISFLSTALATPKLMFGREPYILLLYKLVDSSVDDVRIEEYYDKLRELYSDPERIMIPETKEELMQDIDKINSE